MSEQLKRAKGRLKIAEDLLERITSATEEGPTGDPEWWREYFMFTGQHMILTDEGWQPGECKEECEDDGIEILDEVNDPQEARNAE